MSAPAMPPKFMLYLLLVRKITGTAVAAVVGAVLVVELINVVLLARLVVVVGGLEVSKVAAVVVDVPSLGVVPRMVV